MKAKDDVIAAIATAPGRSSIGVIRVSGPRLDHLVKGLIARSLPPRRAVFTPFRDANGRPIDHGIALYFPGPGSYTGEDVLELQGHGGPVVLRMLLERCLELGARVAEPGEFTRRAFLNDRLDLVQAEGVIDLIDATTSAAARSAVRSLDGQFSSKIQELISGVVELRALVEATLDFPDDEVDFLKEADAAARLQRLLQQLELVLEAARQGSLLREGMHIVLAGQPNVGKSSLLNRLAGEDLAIVTDIPGTTRDTIRQAIDIGGVPAYIVDTAGLRDPRDPVERLGIGRTWSAIEKADIVLMLIDAAQGETAGDRQIVARLPAALRCVRVMNKIDLLPKPAAVAQQGAATTIWLSAKTGEGIDLLRAELLRAVGWHGTGEGVFLARARHLEALHSAQRHVREAAAYTSELELMAEELRLGHEALTTITGEFTSDDLLGEIFSRFCIGK